MTVIVQVVCHSPFVPSCKPCYIVNRLRFAECSFDLNRYKEARVATIKGVPLTPVI